MLGVGVDLITVMGDNYGGSNTDDDRGEEGGGGGERQHQNNWGPSQR